MAVKLRYVLEYWIQFLSIGKSKVRAGRIVLQAFHHGTLLYFPKTCKKIWEGWPSEARTDLYKGQNKRKSRPRHGKNQQRPRLVLCSIY